ncbi:helix-turn-helix domain-containing protein [Streptomyces sp. SID14515]|nr:helix-turn-helix domain-containing protein [Streptomyces sp. SID14515]NEB42096.1 helix-turn-helix domain-containing protein [Streptomyces sp. SID14515]
MVVIDDHPAILSGVEMWYSASPRLITVVAAGASVREAWTAPGSTADVVVLDLQLGETVPAFSSLRRLVDADRPQLSTREENVLIEWFQSESKELVAQRLGISVRTVNSYLDRVRIKYANVGRPARTKASLVARAVQDGLVDVDDL